MILFCLNIKYGGFLSSMLQSSQFTCSAPAADKSEGELSPHTEWSWKLELGWLEHHPGRKSVQSSSGFLLAEMLWSHLLQNTPSQRTTKIHEGWEHPSRKGSSACNDKVRPPVTEAVSEQTQPSILFQFLSNTEICSWTISLSAWGKCNSYVREH